MTFDEIRGWLLETDPAQLESLWAAADRTRAENVGDQVHLRGLIEISNICRRQCLYCGIRAGNAGIHRYRLTEDEVLNCARTAAKFGYGSIVIQSGEDSGLDAAWVAEIVRKIKTETDLAITLSLGERSDADWILWKQAGADRYLLRFETSNARLFKAIHPPTARNRNGSPTEPEEPRVDMLRKLRGLGYEIGSGVMVGIPGQSYTDLVNDLQLFRDLNLDMIGLGPFLPHPNTPLGQLFESDPETGTYKPGQPTEEQRLFFEKNGLYALSSKDQVSSSELLAFKMIALTRLLCPRSNIPSTTAIATINGQNGRKLGLSRGANVVMPNLTPLQYRKDYEIYPNKAATQQTPEQTHEQVLRHLSEIGRTPGIGRGDSRVYAN